MERDFIFIAAKREPIPYNSTLLRYDQSFETELMRRNSGFLNTAEKHHGPMHVNKTSHLLMFWFCVQNISPSSWMLGLCCALSYDHCPSCA